MNEIYQKSKTCQKPAIEISVACQAGQGKPARQGRKNLPLAGLAGQVADPSSTVLVSFTLFRCMLSDRKLNERFRKSPLNFK